MKHKILNSRTVTTYECGSCNKMWDEEGEDTFSHTFPDDYIGEEAECEHCGKELEVTHPYDEEDEDEEGT